MTEPGLVERRRHLRAYIPILVSMRCEGAPVVFDGLLSNLSEGGALVACQTLLSPGKVVQLTLHMPGGGDIHITASVVRTGRYSDGTRQVAFAFDRVHRQSGSIIEEYIRSDEANRHSRSVLLADSSPKRLRQVSDQLITRGYRPLMASTLLQATTWLDAELDSIVLALVGQNLLSGSSGALLKWLHETHPSLHRAILSDCFNGTQLQHTLDRVARERSPMVPWEIG